MCTLLRFLRVRRGEEEGLAGFAAQVHYLDFAHRVLSDIVHDVGTAGKAQIQFWMVKMDL